MTAATSLTSLEKVAEKRSVWRGRTVAPDFQERNEEVEGEIEVERIVEVERNEEEEVEGDEEVEKNEEVKRDKEGRSDPMRLQLY